MVWRSIVLNSDATFWELASAIFDTMGWEVIHLFAFKIEKDFSDSCQNIALPFFGLDDTIPTHQKFMILNSACPNQFIFRIRKNALKDLKKAFFGK